MGQTYNGHTDVVHFIAGIDDWLSYHAQHHSQREALVVDDRCWKYGELTVAPLFHIGGLNVHTLPALDKGTKVVLHPHFDPADCEGKLAHFKIPKYLVKLEVLPHTTTDKVRKHELRQNLIDNANLSMT